MSSVIIIDTTDFAALGLLALGVYAHAPIWLIWMGLGWVIYHIERTKRVEYSKHAVHEDGR